jgi:hypothetical protein
MQTLFNGFDNLPDDEIRMQIALLSGVKLSGKVRGFFTSGSSKGAVMNIYEALAPLSRKDLDDRLRQELLLKIRALTGGTYEDVSDERLHILTVFEAGKAYRVDDYFTPSQKFDLISVEYYEHYLRTLKKRIQKFTPQEANELELAIQKAIPRTDLEHMRQLANDLMLREFNGKTIRIKLMSDTGSQVLSKVIRVFGLGIFDAVETVIATCSDSVMMLCRMERILLAQCVWMASNGYGRKMAYNDDLMPSYSENLKVPEKEEENEKEKYLLNLIAREAKLNKDIKNTLEEINRLNRQQVIAEEHLDGATRKMTALENELDEAEVNYDKVNADSTFIREKYEKYLRMHQAVDRNDMVFRQLKQDYEGCARTIRSAKALLDGTQKNIQKQAEIIDNGKNQLHAINSSIGMQQEHLIFDTREFNQVVTDLENEADYRARIVEKRWNHYYRTWQFDKKVFDNLVKSFTQREIVAIERFLREMDEASDKNSFIIKDNVLYCYVRTGKYARIEFTGNVINAIKVKGRN